jgi:hypothetical protein
LGIGYEVAVWVCMALVERSFDHGSDISISTKGVEFLDQLCDYNFSRIWSY